MNYDFILFENYPLASNHYFDVAIIARMLKLSGYKVAVADVYGRGLTVDEAGVDNLEFKCRIALKKFVSKCKFTPVRVIENRIINFIAALQLKNAVRSLKGRYKHLYAGSFYTKMSLAWLREVPSESVVFLWGLRSSRLIVHKLHPFSIKAFYSWRASHYINRHKNIAFFVSNEIIYDEFLKIGISKNRLVIRNERPVECVRRIIKEKESGRLSLLTIGTLRPDKRVEMGIRAVNELQDYDISYVVAGCVGNDSYETVLSRAAGNNPNIVRIPHRLDADEYVKYLSRADYLILCDKKGDSSVTNGTMNEALIVGVPIIAPNYDPYRYYINKYGIGILFDPENPDSLKQAILRAKSTDPSDFTDNIFKYNQMNSLDSILPKFKCELSRVIDNIK